VICINYTTYDIRQAQDSFNPRTHADVMVLSHEDEDPRASHHPYWYAHIISIFHANIRHIGPASQSSDPQKMDFLWVRWFGHDMTHQAGWKALCLYRLGFLDHEDPGAFGFLDPAAVICGVHIVPAPAYGRTTELLPPSIARQPSEDDKDWVYYYISM